jgi:hypothetical protein
LNLRSCRTHFLNVWGLNFNIFFKTLMLGNVHDFLIRFINISKLNSFNVSDTSVITQVICQILDFELFGQKLILLDVLSICEVILVKSYSIDFECMRIKIVFLNEFYKLTCIKLAVFKLCYKLNLTTVLQLETAVLKI